MRVSTIERANEEQFFRCSHERSCARVSSGETVPRGVYFNRRLGGGCQNETSMSWPVPRCLSIAAGTPLPNEICLRSPHIVPMRAYDYLGASAAAQVPHDDKCRRTDYAPLRPLALHGAPGTCCDLLTVSHHSSQHPRHDSFVCARAHGFTTDTNSL